MNCQEIDHILQMYVDGATDEGETRLAEEHLTGCPECRTRFDGWRTAAEALHSLGPVTAPPGFVEQVMRQVRTEPVPNLAAGVLPSHHTASPLRLSWSWAAAAVVMIGLGLVLWLGPEGSAAAQAARGVFNLVGQLLHR